jgi:gamma-glutamyltranspeptidase
VPENDIFYRWMIFQYQEFRTHSVSGLHRVCTQIVYDLTVCSSCADNYPEANKRPLSSTAPTIVEHSDGSFYVAVGGSGGAKIFPAIFQVMLNLDWGLDIGSAVEYGRLHHQLYPEWIEADNIYPHELLLGLKARGHSIHGACRFILNMLGVMT